MAIRVDHLTKRYGDFTALGDVSVDVPSGSLTALLGPSGCGKSTLLRSIAGLERPDDGTITIDGRDVSSVPVRERGVGFVFQHYAAFRHMSVAENVAFGLRVRKQPKAQVRKRVDEMLELVQLTGWANRKPAQLSGGQRQRMALARALAVEPDVLLLDEPFGALDAKVRRDLRDWLRRLHDDVHVTTVFVTHDREEAMEISDRIVVMNHGKVEQTGSPTEIYERPANPFVMEFVGPVTEVGDGWARPHDLQLLDEPADGSTQVMVQRAVWLGFEVRVRVETADGRPIEVQLTRGEAESLELADGQILWLRSERPKDFVPAA